MPDITVINLKEVTDYLDNIPEDSFLIAKKEMAAALLKADKAIKTNTALKRRTGNLFKSIQTRVEGRNLETLRASIYTDTIYAPTHEWGATIRAKNAYKGVPGGPYLNIPTTTNKTPAGVMRLSAREVFAKGGYVMKFKSGKYGVAIGTQIYFTLHKQVKIPARLGMIKHSEDEVPTMLSRIADQIGGK